MKRTGNPNPTLLCPLPPLVFLARLDFDAHSQCAVGIPLAVVSDESKHPSHLLYEAPGRHFTFRLFLLGWPCSAHRRTLSSLNSICLFLTESRGGERKKRKERIFSRLCSSCCCWSVNFLGYHHGLFQYPWRSVSTHSCLDRLPSSDHLDADLIFVVVISIVGKEAPLCPSSIYA